MSQTSVFTAGCATGAALGALIAWYLSGGSTEHIVDCTASSKEDFKMVLVVRRDLPMSRGKAAAQCAHAAVACVEVSHTRSPQALAAWRAGGQAKITLQCDSLEELMRLQTRASRLGVVARSISDAGRTELEPGSVTVLGIGPAPVKLINEITGHLKLY